jgi:hypothetical protein
MTTKPPIEVSSVRDSVEFTAWSMTSPRRWGGCPISVEAGGEIGFEATDFGGVRSYVPSEFPRRQSGHTGPAKAKDSYISFEGSQAKWQVPIVFSIDDDLRVTSRIPNVKRGTSTEQ